MVALFHLSPPNTLNYKVQCGNIYILFTDIVTLIKTTIRSSVISSESGDISSMLAHSDPMQVIHTYQTAKNRTSQPKVVMP